MGLTSADGRRLMEGFDLNSQVPLEKTLKAELDVEKGTIYLHDFIAKKHLRAPKEATHVNITGILSKIDFDGGNHELNSKNICLKLGVKKQNISLKLDSVKGKGFHFYLLQMCFLKEKGEQLQELKEGNSLTILTVEVPGIRE